MGHFTWPAPDTFRPQNKRKFIYTSFTKRIGYGVAVTSMTLTHQPGVRLPVSEIFCRSGVCAAYPPVSLLLI
jgi:hypothetical protein